MKKLILLAALLAAAPACLFAQGVKYHDIVIDSSGNAVPNATIRVCTQAAIGTPCTPTASIYSDAGLSAGLTNPFTADSTGNFSFYAAAGIYKIQVSGTGISTYTLSDVPLIATGSLVSFRQLDNIVFASQYGSLSAACTALGGSNGLMVVDGNFSVAASASLPSNCQVGFTGTGLVTIASGQTLTFGNGNIIAPPTGQIFAGPGAVAGLLVSRPEWFGTTNCCQAAVNALSANGGTVYLNNATYVSDYNAATMETLNNVTFQGTQMPVVNAGKTALANGTIIQGRWALTGNNLRVYDLGVDSGSTFIGVGADQDAFIAQAPGTTNILNFTARNVSCLVKASTSLFHCFDVEHVDGGDIRNIHTTYGVHGVVYKGTNGTISGIYAQGHQQDAVILKCNGTTYGSCGNINVSDVHAQSIVSPDTGGIKLEADDEPLDAVSITGFTGVNLSYGFILAGAASPTSNTVSGVSISGVKLSGFGTGAGSSCVSVSQSVKRVSINGLACDNMDRGLVTDGTASAGSFALGQWVLTNMNNAGIDTDITNLQINGLQANVTTGPVINQHTLGNTQIHNIICGTSPCMTVAASGSVKREGFPVGVGSGPGVSVQTATVSSCTTGAVAGNTCSTTVTWPSAWLDTSYNVTCSTIDATGKLISPVVTGTSTTTVTVQAATNTNSAASGFINCVGIHQ